MARVRWLDVNGDVSDTANYSSGALPANSDILIVDKVTTAWTLGLTAMGAITGLIVEFGRDVAKAIGTSSQSLTFGNSTTIRWDCPICPEAFIAPAATSTKVEVIATASTVGALTLTGGTITDVYLLGGSGLLISGATVTNLHGVSVSAACEVGASATLSTLLDWGGGHLIVKCALPTTLDQYGGRIHHDADGVNGGTCNIFGGLFLPEAKNGVYTALNAKGGKIDGVNVSHPRTATNSEVRGPNGSVFFSNKWTLTNALKVYNSKDWASPSVSIEVPAQA